MIGGGEDAYEEAFKISADEFDQQFEKYLKDRFKPFRDKERPADYGRNLDAQSGEVAVQRRATPLNRRPRATCWPSSRATARDREGDIVLVSSHDGCVVRNLTKGFDQDNGFEFIVTPAAAGSPCHGSRGRAPDDRLAYFVRTEKTPHADPSERADWQDRAAHRRCARWTTPSRPTSRLTARKSPSPRCRTARATSSSLDLQTKEITNLTKDDVRRFRRRPGRPTADPSSTSHASAATRSCSASTSPPDRRHN